MKYLLYYQDGLIKKFPLVKQVSQIGFSRKNDLVLKDKYISEFHLKVTLNNDRIEIEDLHSTNGTYVNHSKVRNAILQLNDSFTIGKKELYFKQGDREEFVTAKELIPIFNSIREEEKTEVNRKTKYENSIYLEIYQRIIDSGKKEKSYYNFIRGISSFLSNLKGHGGWFLISEKYREQPVLIHSEDPSVESGMVQELANEKGKRIFESLRCEPVNREYLYSAFPFTWQKDKQVFVHLAKESRLWSLEIYLALIGALASAIPLIEFRSTKPDIKPPVYLEKKENGLIGTSSCIKAIQEKIKKIAGGKLSILIAGSTGTGKEVVAKLIHDNSSRAENDFVAINCAAIPRDLLEKELFGNEKGAFTSADTSKPGKFELASGGTLVLDEIGDMPIELQAKLLRALQEKEFYRLGGLRPIKVDFRVISLTNQNLKAMVNQKQFRKDLYYRLAPVTIKIDPLNKRKEDIPLLINHFTNKFAGEMNKNVAGYSEKALKILMDYDWPGNVRELENEVENMVTMLDDGAMIGDELISDDVKEIEKNSLVNKPLEIESEKKELLRLLINNHWNKSRTARDLNMSWRGLDKKMKRLKIERPKD